MEKVLRIGIVIGIALFLRSCITFHPYSGENKPPMYGDYEAQRHWQEITFNLPIEHWYKNTSDNDLDYWGLDYPPLTAYHSLIIGIIANKIDPQYVELHKSRGHESEDHKTFMRFTVTLSDLFAFIIPMMIFYLNVQSDVLPEKKIRDDERNFFATVTNYEKFCISAFIYPGIIVIDHGHFQYNCVSLGFFLMACIAINRDRLTIASIFFVCALNYKQMELYHAIPFFIYILGQFFIKCEQKSVISGFKLLFSVIFGVMFTFVVIWAPFWMKDLSIVLDVLKRLFPVGRGIYEDKVANFWCFINIFIKLKQNFSNLELAKYCLFITTISVIPSSVDLLMKPTKKKFFLSLINVSMNFFLFSFHVHEKSILLVALPILLHFQNDPFICYWFSIISMFSLLPLLMKDGLFIAYIGLTTIYYVSFKLMWKKYFFTTFLFGKRKFKKDFENNLQFIIKICFYSSIIGVVLLSIGSICLKPHERYPDLLPLLVSVYSFIHFVLFAIYFHIKQFITDSDIIKTKVH